MSKLIPICEAHWGENAPFKAKTGECDICDMEFYVREIDRLKGEVERLGRENRQSGKDYQMIERQCQALEAERDGAQRAWRLQLDENETLKSRLSAMEDAVGAYVYPLITYLRIRWAFSGDYQGVDDALARIQKRLKPYLRPAEHEPKTLPGTPTTIEVIESTIAKLEGKE